MIDAAIISHAKTPELKAITEQAVRTFFEHTPKGAKLVVVEGNRAVKYKGAVMLYPHQEFNYNAYGNLALKAGENALVGLFNNDVVFTAGWLNKLSQAMEKYNLQSASPRCPKSAKFDKLAECEVSIGFKVRKHLMGWAIVLKRDLYADMGGFPESYRFWMSDHIYGDKIREYGARHGLVWDSVVHHLESKTLKTLPENLKAEFTHKEKKRYQER